MLPQSLWISVDICSFTLTDTCTTIELKDVLPLLVQSVICNGKITGYSSPMLIFDLKIVMVVQQKQKPPDYNCKIASIDVCLLHPAELWHQKCRAILLDGRPLFPCLRHKKTFMKNRTQASHNNAFTSWIKAHFSSLHEVHLLILKIINILWVLDSGPGIRSLYRSFWFLTWDQEVSCCLLQVSGQYVNISNT